MAISICYKGRAAISENLYQSSPIVELKGVDMGNHNKCGFMINTFNKYAFMVLPLLLISAISGHHGLYAQTPEVSIYRIFEKSIDNSKNYPNKFTDIELRCSYTAPSGKKWNFFGFFDGDGKGGGNKSSGNVWKLRFMPDEPGLWRYQWTWSDGSTGGQGEFSCVSDGAGKGILRAYAQNPRWLAYNGTEPVFIKAYYESGTGSLSQPFDWVVNNVYQVLIDNGYNYLQVNWLLPLCRSSVVYTDGPAQSVTDLELYESGKASSTMKLNVWKLLETHVDWLNERNVAIHPFMGFSGGKNGGLDWAVLSDKEKDFFVRYVIARLAPFANIACWNYVWEVDGNDEKGELALMRLIQKYDVFNHLRTYQDEMPVNNEFKRPEYTYASVENHLDEAKKDRDQWKEGWTHHDACLVNTAGKPVIMVEGNALWVRYWKTVNDIGATPDNLRQAAWGCITAGASFIWSGHWEPPLVATGPKGLPFTDNSNAYRPSARQLDVLSKVMTEEVIFHRMTPNDALLSSHDKQKVWCLAEPGNQYLVFSTGGKSFSLNLQSGSYTENKWIDTKTGTMISYGTIEVPNQQNRAFSPPSSSTDWVLLLRGSIAPRYTVTKQATPGGTITQTPEGTSLKESTLIKFTAVPNKGWSFSGWSGDYSGTENSLTIPSLSSDISVLASFAPLDKFVYEAEYGILKDALKETKNAGFTGEAYVNISAVTGSCIEIPVFADEAGQKVVFITFANGSGTARQFSISVNGTQQIPAVNFEPTANWTTWEAKQVSLTLPQGASTITLATIDGQDGPNIDKVTIDHGTTSLMHSTVNGNSLSFYNPAKKTLFILENASKELKVNIYSLNGKTVHSKRYKTGAKYCRIEVSLTKLRNGIYIVKIEKSGIIKTMQVNVL